jgi:aminomethyltransferase
MSTLEQRVIRTALFDRHSALGARMGAFAGYDMPMWYEGIKAEHLAVRSAVGIFDLSHMGEIFIDGPEAYDLVQWLTCNDVRRIGDGQCQYTLFPTPEGGTIDDLIVYQTSPESYMLVVNASNVDKDFEWINRHNKFDAVVKNRSDELSLIAVAGPRTDELLRDFGLKNIASQQAFTFKNAKVDGNKLIVAGTGYTGERGFELIIENDKALWLWDRLLEVGAPYGVQPIGLGARDTLRLEMAYSLYGSELGEDISVYEANLAWTVRLGKDFIGREFLARQKEEGVKRIIAGIVVDGRQGAPRHSAPVYTTAGQAIGQVTSGSFSPSLEKGIALAFVPPALSTPGTDLLVEIRGKHVPAKVVQLPFYKPGK